MDMIDDRPAARAALTEVLKADPGNPYALVMQGELYGRDGNDRAAANWYDWALQAGFRVPEPKQVVELDTMFAVARAAERGVGIALVPWILLDAWFEDGDLVRVSPALLATEDRYFLTVRPDDEARPEVQAVVQWALREFRRTEA